MDDGEASLLGTNEHSRHIFVLSVGDLNRTLVRLHNSLLKSKLKSTCFMKNELKCGFFLELCSVGKGI